MGKAALGFGPFELDREDRLLRRDGEVVPLTPKAFAVLDHLAERALRVCTKTELLQAHWPGSCVTEDALKVIIREIRIALGDDARAPRYLQTLHRRGYRFLLPTQTVGPEVRSIAGPSATPQSTLLGRATELSALTHLAHEVRQGAFRIALIEGEAGIGKSALARHFLSRLAAEEMEPSAFARGQCLESIGAPEPWAPFLDAVQNLSAAIGRSEAFRHFDEWAPSFLHLLPNLVPKEERPRLQAATLGASPARQQRELIDALIALARARPLFLLLEDLQWADSESLQSLIALARHHEAQGFCILLTLREENSAALSPLRVSIAERPTNLHLRLGALNTEEIRALACERLSARSCPMALADALEERSKGHPLILEHLILQLASDGRLTVDQEGALRLTHERDGLEAFIPDALRRMVEGRLQALAPADLELLEFASLSLTPRIDVQALSQALERDLCQTEEAITEMIAGGLLLTNRLGGPFAANDSPRFAHELIREILVLRIPAERQRAIHARWLAALSATMASDREEILLARHAQAAGDSKRMQSHLFAAALEARKRRQCAHGIAHLDLALRGKSSMDENERARLLLLRGRMHRDLDQTSAAVIDFEAAASAALSASDHAQAVEALVLLANATFWTDRLRCREIAARAEQVAEKAKDPRWLAHARGYAAHLELNLGAGGAESLAASIAAEQQLTAIADEGLRAFHATRLVYGHALNANYEAAAQAGQVAIAWNERADEAHDWLVALFWWSWADLHAGHWTRARASLEDGRAKAQRNGQATWFHLFSVMLAHLQIECGDPDAAESASESALAFAADDPEQKGQLLHHARIILARAKLEKGQSQAGLDLLHHVEQARRDAPYELDRLLALPLLWTRAKALRQMGDDKGARGCADELKGLAEELGELTYAARSELLALSLSDSPKVQRRHLEAARKLFRTRSLGEPVRYAIAAAAERMGLADEQDAAFLRALQGASSADPLMRARYLRESCDPSGSHTSSDAMI